jgi:cytoskeletal protein CcmA (bactofilin family)
MEITGDIQGCGTVHIDGILHGDLKVEEGVVIGQNGKVFGTITTSQLTISGTVEGKVFCDELEVTETGIVSDDIHAINIHSDGTLHAFILAEEKIHINSHGKVTTDKMQSKHVIVNGQVEGNVTATEMLEINKDGSVHGEMTITKIKVAEGGIMLGQMQTYRSGQASDAVTDDPDEKVEDLPEGSGES